MFLKWYMGCAIKSKILPESAIGELAEGLFDGFVGVGTAGTCKKLSRALGLLDGSMCLIGIGMVGIFVAYLLALGH